MAWALHIPRCIMTQPVFQMPFFYHQKWRASTYTGHYPNQNSIDLSRIDGAGEGAVVVASAGGTIVDVGPVLSSTGVYYGDYVNIDHGGGWETRYLHIVKAPSAVEGMKVVRGQRLGTVGKYNDMGVHLHYTQLKDGVAVRVAFNGTAINVHMGAVRSDGTFPTQDLISNNAPADISVVPTSNGASVSCKEGCGIRAAVECVNVKDLESVQHGSFVAAGETSKAKAFAGWTVTDRFYELS
jgi:murein DD-endopeptidase MepM/ murein hydrolase activator NlpD